MSIYRKIQNAKQNPDTVRTGSYWSAEEDQKLADSVLADVPLAKIALDHQRTCGGIELRIRSIAYNEYEKNPDKSLELVISIANKYRINTDDFSMFVRDKERYKQAKAQEQKEKDEEKRKLRLIREEEEKKLREEKDEEKRKIREAREEEKRKIREAREQEEQKKKDIKEEAEKKRLEIKEEEQKKKEEEKKLKEELDNAEYSYIYCLREREFVRTGENIYKCGKTTTHPFKRIKQYPNGSEICLILKVNNCHVAEQEMLKYLDGKFKQALVNGQRIGREYYEGLEEEIIQAIFECLIN